MLLRARAPMLEGLDNLLKSNSGWQTLVRRAQSKPDAISRYLTAKARYEALTPADIRAMAARYLNPDQAVEIEQTDCWDTATATGSVSFVNKSVSVINITATMQLSEQDGRTTNRLSWTVECGIPLVGGKLAEIIADGRIDGTLVKPNSHDWDLAAADLILQRAGGSLTDLEGQVLVYNRADVTHPVLCAASAAATRARAISVRSRSAVRR